MFSLRRRPKQRKSKFPTTKNANIGGGRRVYAIGDVHGRRDLLTELLQTVMADHQRRGPIGEFRLIFLGDLIDRGPDSAGVVSLVMEVTERWPGVECLMGNHEEVLLLALGGEAKALQLIRKLGYHTLLSYGIDPDLIRDGEPEALLAAMHAQIPEAHCEYLSSRPDSVVVGDYCFVHAGIRPGIPAPNQWGRDLRWIRDKFLSSDEPHSHVIIHGHSISPAVDVKANRIGIDTGAFRSGRLTAIGLEARDRWFIST